MPILKSCCGCVSLRTGTQIILMCLLVISILTVADAPFEINSFIAGKIPLPHLIAQMCFIVTLICTFVAWMGIQKGNAHQILLPAIMAFFFVFIPFSYFVFTGKWVNIPRSAPKIQLAVDIFLYLVFICLNFYSFIVVLSFYQELKSGSTGSTPSPNISI